MGVDSPHPGTEFKPPGAAEGMGGERKGRTEGKAMGCDGNGAVSRSLLAPEAPITPLPALSGSGGAVGKAHRCPPPF